MIIITRTFKTLSPCGGCHNYIHHKETKCFDDDDTKGVEEYMNTPESELEKRTFGYEIYNLSYDVKKV